MCHSLDGMVLHDGERGATPYEGLNGFTPIGGAAIKPIYSECGLGPWLCVNVWFFSIYDVTLKPAIKSQILPRKVA